jgi:hypothetical protein
MTDKIKIFKLESENLTNVGGPMGMNDSSINWSKLFNDIDVAKAHAVIDYKKGINWKTEGKRTHSGDLGYVMYTITEVEVL